MPIAVAGHQIAISDYEEMLHDTPLLPGLPSRVPLLRQEAMKANSASLIFQRASANVKLIMRRLSREQALLTRVCPTSECHPHWWSRHSNIELTMNQLKTALLRACVSRRIRLLHQINETHLYSQHWTDFDINVYIESDMKYLTLHGQVQSVQDLIRAQNPRLNETEPIQHYGETWNQSEDIVGIELCLGKDHHFHQQPVYQELCRKTITLASDLIGSARMVQEIKTEMELYLIKKHKL